MLGKLGHTRRVALPAGQLAQLREERLLGLRMELSILEGAGGWEEEKELVTAPCQDASCLS